MTNGLYELYSSYKDRDIDDEFISKAFDYVMENEESLWPYIRDFKIINETSSSFGSYHNEQKIITINKQKLNSDDLLYKNMIALQVIKHEVEHARNLQKLEQLKHDIESEVIFYSLRSYAMANGIDKTKMHPLDELILMANTNINYKTNPGERIADIKSWKYLVNLLKNRHKTEELLTVRSMLYYAYIRGYEDNRYYLDCPTYSFLLETNQLSELKLLKKRVDKNNYSLDTRLLCGLPISQQEYDKETLTKARLQRVHKK